VIQPNVLGETGCDSKGRLAACLGKAPEVDSLSVLEQVKKRYDETSLCQTGVPLGYLFA
jgi:hypothetical protein